MLSSWLIRFLTRLPQRGIVTLATNIPGPRRQLQMMGREVARLLPIPPIALRLRTGVAVLSYANDLVFGITADYDAAADVDELAKGIAMAVARLEMLSQDSILLFAEQIGLTVRRLIDLTKLPASRQRAGKAGQANVGHHRSAPLRRGAVRPR